MHHEIMAKDYLQIVMQCFNKIFTIPTKTKHKGKWKNMEMIEMKLRENHEIKVRKNGDIKLRSN